MPARDALTEIDLGHAGRPTRFQTALGLGELEANAMILRDERWSCVHFNGDVPPMLFDRQSDPDEGVNLATDSAGEAQVARMRTRMRDLRMTRSDRRLTAYQFGA